MERARRARRTRYVLKDEHITLSHGSGGKATHNLIEGLLLPAFGGGLLDAQEDAAVVTPYGGRARLAFTTDSFVVSPLFFPGGDIGKLAVNGTVNDLAMAGAQPLYLSVGLILEEGLEVSVLRAVIQSMAEAAGTAGVAIVTGDTKVVPRGKADRLFVNTSGVGIMPDGVSLTQRGVRPGDRVLLSGFVGDHGMAVMLAREALELEAEIVSDTAPLAGLVAALLTAAPGTRCLKDPTRGGVASSLNEIAQQAGVGITVEEERVPVRGEVRAACEILGIDPLHIANEGKLMAVVPREEGDAALAALRAHPLGLAAAIIGEVVEQPEGMVVLRTGVGGSRVLDMLVGDPLPRIC
ncbi:MAG: hydrogenase expression/formation protein HypE [Gemmatimonadales bacterium]|nr:hydrogenase expression/formation protein HypE [Gemmatimonadales bacterium]